MKFVLALLLLAAPLVAQTSSEQKIVFKVAVTVVQTGAAAPIPAPPPSPPTTTAPPGSYSCNDIVVGAAQSSMRAGGHGTLQFYATANGQLVSGGNWGVGPSFAFGGIDGNGLYMAPDELPSPATSTIYYFLPGCTRQTNIALLNYAPQIASFEPAVLWQLNTVVTIHGSNFLPGATLTINGQPTPVTFLDKFRLSVNLNLPSAVSQPLNLVVTNPDPGSASAALSLPTNFPTFTSVTPSTFVGGVNTLILAGTGITDYSRFTFDGKPLYPTRAANGTYTASIFVAPWRTGSIQVAVNSIDGAPASSTQTIPIQSTTIPFDLAARFSTQAAFGPRIDIVQHIQQVGLQAFVAEQLAQPPVTYTQPGYFSARSQYMRAAAYGNSLLRLRVATALGSFIVNVADNNDYASYSHWEGILENGAFGSYRDLLTNITADPRMGNYLNLAGDNASSNPNLHPNQNYARELMQLFTLGSFLLNQDGSLQLTADGQPIPTYDQNTLLDLTRALTGWNYAAPVDPSFTSQGIDYSQPLIARDDLHDHGAKTLFGSIHLPAGQDIVADRAQALDSIFNHPNLPPFVSRILIQHLVKSNPSPAYIQRIGNVFKDNGRGVRGDMAAVVSAILLDPEARVGDSRPSPDDGFLQDPVLFQAFAINALQQDYPDNQPTFTPGQIGQPFWYAPSVNGFYSPAALIPGTSILSPEFSLWNNLSLVHRSQLLYGIISGSVNGFGNDYINRSWLFQNFKNVPDLVDALDHLLYHGTMPPATKSSIVDYCASLDPANPRQQFLSAIFLALNSDSFNVTH